MEQMYQDGHGHHGGFHWSCCVLPIITKIFWVAGIVFAIAAWVSVIKNQLVWGYGAQWWVINALMFGLLSLYGRGKKHGCCGEKCESCMVKKEHSM